MNLHAAILCLAAAALVAPAQAQTDRKVKTTFQTSREWRPTIDNRADAVINHQGNRITVEGWVIECNLDSEGKAFLHIENTQNGASLDFNYNSNKGATTIVDQVGGKRIEKRLVDSLPKPEI